LSYKIEGSLDVVLHHSNCFMLQMFERAYQIYHST